MTAVELYDKFITNHRKPQSAYFRDTLSKNATRCGLYRLKKRRGETFKLIQKGNQLTIVDRLFNI